MIVDDRPIGEVVAALRPWVQGVIILRGTGLARRRVTGIYDLRHPDDALAALGRAQPMRFSRITPWVRVVTVD